MVKEFVDERQKSWCIHCGTWLSLADVNRDHVPSKGLMLRPFPPNLPVVQVCAPCNNGFSKDEEYLVALLGAVLAGSAEPDERMIPTAAGILRRNPGLKERISRAEDSYDTRSGEHRSAWNPEWDRVRRVILKNARGHAFYEIGEPMLGEPASVGALPISSMGPIERQEFEAVGSSFYPEVGSRMLTRVAIGQDLRNGWVMVQEGVYRYAVVQDGGVVVKSVLFEYLATEVRWTDE